MIWNASIWPQQSALFCTALVKFCMAFDGPFPISPSAPNLDLTTSQSRHDKLYKLCCVVLVIACFRLCAQIVLLCSPDSVMKKLHTLLQSLS